MTQPSGSELLGSKHFVSAWVADERGLCARTVADTHAADEMAQARLVQDVADHAVRLALVEPATTTTRDDTARILSVEGLALSGCHGLRWAKAAHPRCCRS